MPDIRLYNIPSTRYPDPIGIVNPSSLAATPALELEILANKVVKFLLTAIGTDAHDPTYGAYLPTYTQISERYIGRFQMEIQQDIQRCEKYILGSEEVAYTDTFLSSIRLLSVEFAEAGRTDTITIEIEILTIDGEITIIHLPVIING